MPHRNRNGNIPVMLLHHPVTPLLSSIASPLTMNPPPQPLSPVTLVYILILTNFLTLAFIFYSAQKRRRLHHHHGNYKTQADNNNDQEKETPKKLPYKQLFTQLEGFADGTWLIDFPTNSLHLSPSYARLLGYDPKDLYLVKMDTWNRSYICPDDFINLDFSTDEPQNLLHRIKNSNNIFQWVLCRFRVLERDLATNEPLLVVGTTFDMSYQKRIEEELKAALDKLQKLLDQRKIFVANMSHELRSPIHGLYGNLQLLEDAGNLTQEQTECITNMNICCETLLQIINDILDFSKLEAGRIPIQSERVNVHDLLQSVIGNFGAIVKKRGLDISYDVSLNVPKWIQSDALRLRQILFNLVGNAVKFTQHGFIKVSVSVISVSENGGNSSSSNDSNEENPVMTTTAQKLVFQVQDTGIGISKKFFATIFDSFSQENSSIVRETGGTGLGLAICRQLVTLMDGHIWLESEQGVGSRFFFSIPLVEIPSDEGKVLTPEPPLFGNQVTESSTTTNPNKSINILLAEDNQVNADMMIRMLHKLGYKNVTHAVNGQIAYDLAKNGDFDVLALDAQMPFYSGLEVTRMIRDLGSTIRQPYIIACTANVLDDDQEKYAKCGMDAFLGKPVTKKRLLEVLGEVSG